MNPLSQAAKSLVRVIRESSAKPFYSPIDKAISEIVQTKGTGEQMLAQILKTKGAAKELKERPAIKAALQQPKITKAELEKIAAENPPPSITEKVDKGPSEVKYKVEHDDLNDKYDVVDDYSNVVKSFRDYDDAQFYAGKLEGGTTRHEKWQLPGGKNYREIKLMLPSQKSDREIADEKLKAFTDKVTQRLGFKSWDFEHMTPSEIDEYEVLNNAALKASTQQPVSYKSSHFPEPNILAHARVSDRTGPNGEKILHVEEIQSDWHQTGRKKGYGPKIEKDVEAYYETKDGQRVSLGHGRTKEEAEANVDNGWKNLVDIKYETTEHQIGGGVPDAPFKQNWHELVMKRLLDDAAKKGYDKVVITPGAEQAKRYNLSKYIDSIELHPNEFPNKDSRPYYFIAYNKNQERVADDTVSEKELENYIGKDLANKLLGMEPNKEGGRYLEGANLVSGGEGMKGFYDQMLPSFLNDYGKKWGARVKPDVIFTNPDYEIVKANAAKMYGEGSEPYNQAVENMTKQVHSFDITPQMREDIVGKGQPLYQAIPAGVGAGTLAAPQEEVPEQPMKKGGAVHLSEGGEPETPEQQFERYLRMLRINASGGKDKYGSSVGGRFGVNIPVAKDVFIEPFVQGFAFKPDTGKLMSGGVGGANLNIRFKNGGDVSEDAMRMAVMNKQLRKRHG